MSGAAGAPVVVCLVTLDTKAREAEFLRDEIRRRGFEPCIVDIGVVGAPGCAAEVAREEVAMRGGRPLADLLREPSREAAAPVMATGAAALLREMIAVGRAQAVLGIGGTQGTSLATRVMQELPYGFPKIMVSTAASGDVSAFVGIKDVTMMFAVSDLLGLNPITRAILANAAGAACGMAAGRRELAFAGSRPVVGMTNLGVLTEGAGLAQELLEAAGFEVIVFHAVGSGGRAMEQMMREGIITAVFDYAMGEIADDVFGGLRAGGKERMRVAGALGLPQVIVPGGSEHLGIFVDPPNTVPGRWADHAHVFHSPVIFVPRLKGEELARVAASVGERLAGAKGPLALFLPEGGTSRYSVAGAPLEDREADRTFFAALEAALPARAEIHRRPEGAEDEAFVRAAVDRLVTMIRENVR